MSHFCTVEKHGTILLIFSCLVAKVYAPYRLTGQHSRMGTNSLQNFTSMQPTAKALIICLLIAVNVVRGADFDRCSACQAVSVWLAR